MNIHNLLEQFAIQENGFAKLPFSTLNYDYSGDPKLQVMGFALYDIPHSHDVRGIEIQCVLEKEKCPQVDKFSLDFKLDLDISHLESPESSELIQQVAIKAQDLVIKALTDIHGIPLSLSEHQELKSWDKTYLLREPCDLEDEFNCIFFGYWTALRIKDALNVWSEKVKA